MLLLVPLIHACEDFLRLMDCEHRPVGKDDKLLIGYDGRYFDDGIAIGFQTRHFEIDPDQVVTARHYACATAIDWLRPSLPEATLSRPERRPGKPAPKAGGPETIICSDRLLVTDTIDSLVIATFGLHLLVRDAAGQERKARPFGRGLV